MNSQGASDEVATKADEIEEHRAGAEGGNESTESESENSSTDGSNLTERNEVADKESEVVAGERPQRIEEEHQHISREPSPHPEAPLTERPNNLRQEEAWGEREAERGREAVGEFTQTSEQQRGKSELTQHGEIPHAEQQHPNNVDKHEHEEKTDSTKTRGGGDASSRTYIEPPNPDKATGEQATDAADMSRIRVHDAMVAHAGELIREWRKEMGLTQCELADKLGQSGLEVSSWEINRLRISLEDLQQMSHIARRDLEQALRGFQLSGSQNITIEWKGAVYSIDAFTESVRNPYAILNFDDTLQTYYLKLSPLADVEFHRRDRIMTMLEKDGVQATAELTALNGARASVKKADVEHMGIKVGDKLNVDVLSVRGPDDPPWRESILFVPTTTNGETRLQLREKLGELGFDVNNGNYARMVIQSVRGERLATGRIENGAIKLSENTANELLARGTDGEYDMLKVKTDGIVLSPEPISEKTCPPAKSRDIATLKLEGEGFVITHENQNYRITMVEKEKVGGLELYRFKTNQGEEFLCIPRENVTIPPYETPWYALPSTVEIYLDKAYKRELLEAAIDKAGGNSALRQELGERGAHIGHACLYRHLHERADGLRIDKLIPILTYLGRDLNEPNSHITAIGDKRSVENPNLPFKLDNIDGARLHSARFSDGSLSVSQDGELRFVYTNNDAEQRDRIVESLTNVFGRANMPNREEYNDKSAKVRTSTDIIGRVLQRSGAVTGKIIKQNPDIPTFIREGSTEMKREWLRQAFGDEGSVWFNRGQVKLSRAVDATHRLSDEQRKRLDVLSTEWKRKTFPDTRGEPTRYCRFDDLLPKDIREALELDRPQLLESEARILQNDFGINTKKYPNMIYTREGGYGVEWVLQTASREDSRMFHKEIGFPQNRKQEVLRRMLGMKGDDTHQ